MFHNRQGFPSAAWGSAFELGTLNLDEPFVFSCGGQSHIGVFPTSQCDRVWGTVDAKNGSIVCEGADPTHLFFLKFEVDPSTGIVGRNDTVLRVVMTPRPYYLRAD